MSSVGPGLISLVTKNKVDCIKNIYKKHNYKILLFDVDNKGGQLL
jgi:hypothetical protein